MSSREGDLPLLATQAQIWAAEQFGTIGRPYNLHWTLSFDRSELTDRAVTQALDGIVERHPSLHARIVSDRGVPFQRLDRPVQVEIRSCDSSDPNGSRTHQALIDELARKRQDLAEDPLTELYLVSAPEQLHVVGLQHHSVSDGLTRSLLAADIDDLAHDRPPVELDDYSAALTESLALEADAVSKVDESVSELAAANAKPMCISEYPSDGGGRSVRTTDWRLGSALGITARTGDTNRVGLVAAAVMGALETFRPSGSTLLGLVVTTRPRPTTRVAGCFVNTTPLVLSSEVTPDLAGARLVTQIVSRQSHLRHLPVGALNAAARSARVALPDAGRVLISTSRLPRSRRHSTHPFIGSRGGLTFRLWHADEAGTVTLESPHSMLPDDQLDHVLMTFSALLCRFVPD